MDFGCRSSRGPVPHSYVDILFHFILCDMDSPSCLDLGTKIQKVRTFSFCIRTITSMTCLLLKQHHSRTMGRGCSQGKIDNLHSFFFVNIANNPIGSECYIHLWERAKQIDKRSMVQKIIQRYKVNGEVYVRLNVYIIRVLDQIWMAIDTRMTRSSVALNLRKETIEIDHGVSTSRSSSSCNRGRLEGAPTPMPLASKTFMATLAAPSDVFFVLARVLRSAPNACALMTATVHEMGAALGEGDLELALRRKWLKGGSPSLLP